ncbi:hypothetical protein [Alteribacter aurantiacus]|uniref:hypothetical protein n=1 Tax=Alteribacter aurantiacus TaxID=254410 RepID=UPI0003FB35F4|nr:hypothetical protein [Alteribacter aurantiacus]
MRTNVYYVETTNDTEVVKIQSEGYLFLPNEGDTLIHDGWGYIIDRKEFWYEQDVTKVMVYCTKERKRRAGNK